MTYRIELLPVPVGDVDASISFYRERAGFTLDHDHRVGEGLRFVQMTPPGSACSIAFGEGITEAEPGSHPGIQVVVPDADAARAELAERGVEVSAVDEQPWGRFVRFSDPDGNPWVLQQILPQS